MTAWRTSSTSPSSPTSSTVSACAIRSCTPASNRSIRPGRQIVVGRAATVLFAPIYHVPAEPYTTIISAIDAVTPGDIPVLATSGIEATFWGELFSNAALARGARGVVMDGYHRDTRKILDLGFPVFSTGSRPVDIAGRAQAIAYDVPVRCGGVQITPGDIVFAEIDGIAVIPGMVADEVVAKAFAKVATEDRAREDLRDGAYLADVWKKYKVL